MILILEQKTSHVEAQQLMDRLISMGLKPVKEQRNNQIMIAIVSGVDAHTKPEYFSSLPHVETVESFSQTFKLASHDVREKLVIKIGDKTIGGDELCVMAGPCSIENEEQIHRIAQSVAKCGAKFLRGGAFKPRTSPYDFQGLGPEGVKYMQAAAKENNLATISEIMDARQLDDLQGHIDILQIGARNMQNFNLLKAVGSVKIPVMLKRGLSATYRELLMAAEYILDAGNPNVMFCERGIRTFETYTRNTLDLAAVPVLHELSHLPVIVDPSHGTGQRHLIAPMSRAAVAAGADGLMIEVHYDPDRSYSDAQQAIDPEHFNKIMQDVKRIRAVVID